MTNIFIADILFVLAGLMFGLAWPSLNFIFFNGPCCIRLTKSGVPHTQNCPYRQDS